MLNKTVFQGITYQVANGTFYHAETPVAIINLIETARMTGSKLRVHYGDAATGRDWMEEYDVQGTIGRSMGPVKIPLLIAGRASCGGGILDHCIVKIRNVSAKGVVPTALYQHPKYHINGRVAITGSTVAGYQAEAVIDGTVHARFKTLDDAVKWKKEMVGY